MKRFIQFITREKKKKDDDDVEKSETFVHFVQATTTSSAFVYSYTQLIFFFSLITLCTSNIFVGLCYCVYVNRNDAAAAAANSKQQKHHWTAITPKIILTTIMIFSLFFSLCLSLYPLSYFVDERQF